MHNSKILSLLLDFGLTEYEARTLTTLFNFVEADAPHISRNAEIPKTRIYDVLEKLKEKGLILEVYGRPKRYKVIDPNEIFKQLIDNKKKEISLLDKQVKDILSKETWSNQVAGVQEKILQVKNLKDYNKLLSQEFENAEKEITGFTSMDDRVEAFKPISEMPEVHVKLISKPITKEFDFPKNFAIQEKEHTMDAFIIDKNKVVMSLNDLSAPKETYHLTILKNNPSLTKALLTHFDDYWKK
ncbi:MAG TPA: helix-turn-helix domain-containing protein [archaeon]|jgi:sugar-specific transcriptional regulator TrmB|nr:helix-turn-helix domain-containing protein [archaeon]HPV66433.1 helix-turn-helix domain-containing protein [archaeon]